MASWNVETAAPQNCSGKHDPRRSASPPRYLACSQETKSEMVVPIRVHGTVAGELDIDSLNPAAFSQEDRKFLEECAIIVGGFIERTQAASSQSK
jgi:L-methionine (R)-S-oxide reductase